MATATATAAKRRTFTINFTGDVMLGRLIDQLFGTQHVHSPEDERIAAGFRARHPEVRANATAPWGSTLPLLQAADLNIINLETAVTTHATRWPDKAFNYRGHPANVARALQAAGIDCCSLANNHTLDFGTEGLVETAWTLKRARIAIAGAGETTDEAISPAILSVPRSSSADGEQKDEPVVETDRGRRRRRPRTHAIHVHAASDHPVDWAAVPTFHLIDYSTATRAILKRLLTARSSHSHPSLKIFSIHWGPNYRWQPSDEIRSLAHFLIDECDVDIVHGHSAHHVQGIECPRPGKLIIYGCGDFVDDYALNASYRNDLGALWRVVVQDEEEEEDEENDEQGGRLRPVRLEIFPTRIRLFQAQLLDSSDPDHQWLCDRIAALTEELMDFSSPSSAKPVIRGERGDRGQLIVDLVD
jgi:poly-gamma-glutamate capsule biosynthesis protein CapA/YwtB (metallophosphatase superfamily)